MCVRVLVVIFLQMSKFGTYVNDAVIKPTKQKVWSAEFCNIREIFLVCVCVYVVLGARGSCVGRCEVISHYAGYKGEGVR